MLTSSETALINPGVHVCALILELLKLVGGVFDLVLEVLNLIKIGSDGIIEGLAQWIGSGFHCCRGNWAGVCISQGERTTRGGIVTLIASGGRSKGLQFVLRIETAGILGVFVRWTLYLLRVIIVGILGIGSGRHWKILFAFRCAISRKSTKPGHDMKIKSRK